MMRILSRCRMQRYNSKCNSILPANLDQNLQQNTLSRKTIVLSDDDLDLNDIEYLGNGNSQKKPKDELEEKLDEWLCSTSSLATTSPQKFEKKKVDSSFFYHMY
jgi:hypothetical protein